MLARVNTIFDRILSIGIICACVFIVLMMLSVNFEVVMRYFFRMPQLWVTQGSEIGLLYVTFFGAAWVLHKEGHVSMDLVLNRLKPRVRAILNSVTSLLAAVVVFPLIWYGFIVTWDHYQRGLYYETNLPIPNVIILWVIPVGSIVIFAQLLRRTYGYWKKRKVAEVEAKEVVLA